jgi:hypothetical protein
VACLVVGKTDYGCSDLGGFYIIEFGDSDSLKQRLSGWKCEAFTSREANISVAY